MNWFKLHIGDYAQATAHLSFIEDAAYSRMLRKYYAEEKPLPSDIRSVQRVVGARSKDERLAVEVILSEFFTLREDGWHNKRCDEELARANAQAETNRKIAEDREARKRAAKQAESNSTNRDVIGHDSLHGSLNESLASREPSQTPDANIQTIHTNKSPAAAGIVCAAMKNLGIQDVNPTNPLLLKVLEAGATVEEFENATNMAKVRKFTYILGTVIRQREQAADTVIANVSLIKQLPWFLTHTGITQKGKELGIAIEKDEQPPAYKIRVCRAAEVTEEDYRKACIDHKKNYYPLYPAPKLEESKLKAKLDTSNKPSLRDVLKAQGGTT